MKRTLFVLFIALAATAAYAADSKFEIAVVATATAVINEAGNTPDHTCRMAIATELWRQPAERANAISPYLASQDIDPSDSQVTINNGVSAWLTTEVTVRKAEGSCS